MIHALVFLALMTAPGQAQTEAQTPPAVRAGSDITRNLNAAPPSAVIAAPVPATVPSPAEPTSGAPTPVPPVVAVPAPVVVAPEPAPTLPAMPLRELAPAPSAVSAAPRTVAPTLPEVVPARPASTVIAPAPVPVVPASPTPTAPVTVLDASAIAALPFTVDLAGGLSITTGRPGPNFNVWTIRRGQQPLVMIYAGPASQFPIYSGEMVDAGGRASVVTTEAGRRVALEHLFTRQAAPREIHVWIASVDGTDRVLAEQVGQSIDVR